MVAQGFGGKKNGVIQVNCYVGLEEQEKIQNRKSLQSEDTGKNLSLCRSVVSSL